MDSREKIMAIIEREMFYGSHSTNLSKKLQFNLLKLSIVLSIHPAKQFWNNPFSVRQIRPKKVFTELENRTYSGNTLKLAKLSIPRISHR